MQTTHVVWLKQKTQRQHNTFSSDVRAGNINDFDSKLSTSLSV